jgi:mRNA-degrading endonuclease RelE of RelBE toxin-antitoxin system
VSQRHDLRIYGPARRTLEQQLPLSAALAVWEFCNGPLRDEPYRVGRSLQRELVRYFSARRGAYRVIYRIDDEARAVHVVRIEHRANVYRPR